jgi:hypothetical protein
VRQARGVSTLPHPVAPATKGCSTSSARREPVPPKSQLIPATGGRPFARWLVGPRTHSVTSSTIRGATVDGHSSCCLARSMGKSDERRRLVLGRLALPGARCRRCEVARRPPPSKDGGAREDRTLEVVLARRRRSLQKSTPRRWKAPRAARSGRLFTERLRTLPWHRLWVSRSRKRTGLKGTRQGCQRLGRFGGAWQTTPRANPSHPPKRMGAS